MKNIKFRAWHPKNEIMVYFDNQKASSDQYICEAMINLMIDNDSGLMMQAINMVDKNGKDVYEGDLMKSDFGIGEVKFLAPSFVLKSVQYDDVYFYIDKSEIIGNCFEKI